MLRISYRSDMGSIRPQLYHRSEDHCYQRSLQDCPVSLLLQTLQLPIPDPPGSRRLQEVCIHDSCHLIILQKVPFQPLQRFPVQGNRWTYRRQEYASYPDVPEGKIRDDEVSPDPLSGNNLSQPVQNTDLVQYDLWKGQNGRDLLSSDP